MKMLRLLLVINILFSFAVATQRMVVGEVFTETW